MRIIYFDNINNTDIFRHSQVVDYVSFLDRESCNKLLKAYSNKEKIKKLFDIIGIKYDDIFIHGGNIFYKLDNEILHISNLSSGERYLLYLMACKELNLDIVAKGLFERLYNRLQDVACKELYDYKNLVVVYYNDYPVELRNKIVRCL